MAATYNLISGQTLTNNTGSVTFNSFSGYTDLVIQANFDVPNASSAWDCYVRFNNDSSGNYDYLVGTNTQSSTFDNGSGANASGIPVVGAFNSPLSSTYPVHFECNIPEYSNSSYKKQGTATFSYIASLGDSRSNTGWMVWNWKNANPITSITVLTTNFNIRGTINLYGILAGNA